MPVHSSIDIYLSYTAEEKPHSLGEACWLSVETTIIIFFSDQIMDERPSMHHIRYMVGFVRKYCGSKSRGNSFTYHQQVVVDIGQ